MKTRPAVRPNMALLFAPTLALAVAVGISACSGADEAETPADAEFPDVTHVLEPTDEMQTVAEQQCLDDPSLDEGYVRAVAPDSGDVLAEVTVACDEVRDGS